LPKSAYPSTVFLTLDIPVATSGKFFRVHPSLALSRNTQA
jgi:hypothetical protein